MADTKESLVSSVHDDPNFAVICSFLTRYGSILGFSDISFEQLEKWINDTRYGEHIKDAFDVLRDRLSTVSDRRLVDLVDYISVNWINSPVWPPQAWSVFKETVRTNNDVEVNESLREILVRLLKRWKSIKEDRWTQYLVKFCHTYSQIDAWELEGFGFERCKTATKLRVLKNLLECQFDVNVKFKEKINALSAQELRCLPLGRDVRGKAYWCLMDNDMNMCIYCEEQDDIQNETWQIIVSDRDQLLNLIASLQQQKSHPDEKSRSATPSTIASDVLGADGNSQSGGLYSSEASLDALPTRASIVKAPGNDEHVGRDLLKIRIKLEVADSAAVDSPKSGKLEDSCSIKSEVEESSGGADEKLETERDDVAVKIEARCEIKPVVANYEDKVIDSAATDNKKSSVKDTKLTPSENVVSDTVVADVVGSNTTTSVTDDKNDCKRSSNIDSSEAVQSLRDNDAEISSNGPVSETDKTHVDTVINNSVSAHCDIESPADNVSTHCDGDSPTSMTKISSPQRRIKKMLERPVSTAATDDAVPKSSGKRKRASLCRTLSTSSSEDGSEFAPHLSESELSDSTVPGSRTQSAGEEEPPTKRKRDKALKTVSQRDRKFIKARVHIASKSPSATTPVTADEEKNNDGRLHTNEKGTPDDSIAEKTCNSETNGVGKSTPDETSKLENENLVTSVKNKDENDDQNVENNASATGDAGVDVDLANDKAPAVDSSSVKEGDEQVPPNESDSSTVCDEADKTLEASDRDDSKTTEDPAPSGDEHLAEKKLEVSAKSAGETENLCNGHSDETVVVSEKDASIDTEKSEAVNEGCKISTENGVIAENEASSTDRKNTVNADATNEKKQGEADDKLENGTTEKLEVDGKSPLKKRRGGSKKRKSQKKRGHCNTPSTAAPTSEVGETDYEPTKKIGRPAGKRKTRVAQIIAEGTDSVTQSEDDVPLSSLKKDEYLSDDSIPLIELRRSSRANKGQRKLDEAAIIDLPKKRNRKEEARQRKLEAKQEKFDTRRKRDAELQEQAVLKAKKKKRGKSDSDDDFVPGKKNAGRKGKGRGGAKRSKTVSEESESGETTDDLDELFEAETEEEVQAVSSSSDHLDSDGSEYVPRGRNAKRAAAIKQKAEAEHISDQPCIRCGKANQPEWILLCDRCDTGYHAACLRPPIMVVPEDDWFCPICEHAILIEKLQEQLEEFDRKAKENVRLMQRKQRLAFVTVNITNVIEDADRRAALKAQVRDLFDDEGSDEDNEEQPSPQPKEKSKSSTDSWRKKQRKKREFDSSLFSSTSEEEEEDEDEDEVRSEESERSNRRPRKRREWDVSSGSEETRESWSINRRSRRQRKQISYKFEEYDELLNAAIEEDVKEEPEVKAPPRRSGKDMSNITGVSESSNGDGASGKRKKRGRHLTRLDSDETEADDESEEFKLSEDEQASSADEDDAGDNGDEDLSDDWSIARGGASNWKKPAARSGQRRRRPTRFKDFVNDDSEEENSDDQLDYRRPRAAAQRRVNYHEISESDSSAGSDQGPKPRKNVSSSRPQQRRRRNNSDSEYQPSSDAEVETVLAPHVVAAGRHKRLGGSSDEAGSETVTKKKGRLNRILSSSESESEESDDVARRFVKSRSEPVAAASIPTGSNMPANCTIPNVPPPPVVNGKHDNDAAVPTVCNAASENNKGFTIANLLKDSSTMLPVSCNRPQLVTDEPDPFEDSLSGIEDLDLVSYVTQT